MIFNIDEENVVQDLKVVGGCNGNVKGIGKLIKGMNIDEIIEKLSGVLCGYRNTSCPDQIAIALKEYKLIKKRKKKIKNIRSRVWKKLKSYLVNLKVYLLQMMSLKKMNLMQTLLLQLQ